MEDQVLKKPGIPLWKWILGILAGVLVLCITGVVFVFSVNRFMLSLQLEGEPEQYAEYGVPYQDPGATPILTGTILWQNGFVPKDVQVTREGEVSPNAIGKYVIHYSARIGELTASAQRIVRVVDTQGPVITLVPDSGETILPGTVYEEPGFSAIDNVDGDITHKVVRTESAGLITYAVLDSSGNPASAQREIPYYDPVAPEILLAEGDRLVIPAGTFYQDPGFTAQDNVDGDLTEQVAVEGEVIWYQPGTYEIQYTVTDAFENQTTVTRTVEVEAQPRPEIQEPRGKVIYLTFDDGPGPHTDELLYLLDYYGIKATFFVMDTGYDHMMRQIVERGHSIGIHTRSHDYETIYASPEAFFEDLYGMQEIIYQNTGVKTTLMRFPGGSSNMVSRFNKGIMTTLTEAVQDAGFQYFDWNVDSNDAGGAKKASTVSANVIGGAAQQRISVVLQHDIHPYSVNAVEDIILWGLDNGYTFLPLEPDSPNAHHTPQN